MFLKRFVVSLAAGTILFWSTSGSAFAQKRPFADAFNDAATRPPVARTIPVQSNIRVPNRSVDTSGTSANQPNVEQANFARTNGQFGTEAKSADEIQLAMANNRSKENARRSFENLKNARISTLTLKAQTVQVGEQYRTPQTDLNGFVTLPNNQGWRDKKSKLIWQDSRTSHSGDAEYKVGLRRGEMPGDKKKITVSKRTNRVIKVDR